ncbi:uncharacterized protein [Solanum lycopersicum]|uniref:uncharacterized protein isoform X2 n=1 Tax=Solanum lycopersicum TaxID=4081 RepID=UPI000532AFF2
MWMPYVPMLLWNLKIFSPVIADVAGSVQIGIQLTCMENYTSWSRTRDNCYKLIGYPADFKGKNKISVANVQNQHTGDNGVTPHPHHIQQPHLTMDQYNQILRLLNKPQLNETSANANMTSILASSSSLIHTHPTHSQWIVDSGATNHMVNDNLFFNTGLTVTRTQKVQVPTAFRTSSMGK